MPIGLKAYALTTAERLRFLGGAPSGRNLDEYNFAINAVSREIAKYCGRDLHQVTHTAEAPEYHEGSGRLYLYLHHYPVVSITAVKVNGSEVTDFRSSTEDKANGRLYRENAWPRLVPAYCDLTRDPDYSRAREHIEVAYIGGYKTPAQGEVEEGEHEVPEDLEMCVFRELREVMTGGDGQSRIKSERTPGGTAYTYFDDGFELSRKTKAVLTNSGYVAPWSVIF
jgi:hypothetical protein